MRMEDSDRRVLVGRLKSLLLVLEMSSGCIRIGNSKTERG